VSVLYELSNSPAGGVQTITDPVTGLSSTVTATVTAAAPVTDVGDRLETNMTGIVPNDVVLDYAFSQGVDNVQFTLYDIDAVNNFTNNIFDDKVSIRVYDADGNLINGAVTFTPGAGTSVVTGTNPDGSAFVEADALANGNNAPVGVVISGSASIYRIEMTQEGGDTGFETRLVQFGDMTVDVVNVDPTTLNDNATMVEDTTAVIDVLGNDSDADNNPLTVTSAGSADGSVTINSDGTLTFDPVDDFAGTTTITYTVSDGLGGTDTATVNVTVTNVNDAPVATPTPATVAEDVDGDDLTVDTASSPNGTVVINSDGSVEFTPESDFTGTTTITYTITDGNGGTATLDNATDVEGDDVTLESATSPNGDVVINSDGTVEFTPASDFTGTTTITYTVTDGNGGTSTGTSTVTVFPVNDVPVLTPTPATVAEDTPVTIRPLDNATDAEGDDVTLETASSPDGDVVINSDGTVEFTPASDFTGTTTITYTVTDGNGGTSTGTSTVTVTPVNDIPVATPTPATVAEDTPVTIRPLDNATDVPDSGCCDLAKRHGCDQF